MKIVGEVTTIGLKDIRCGRCHQSCRIHAFNKEDGSPGHNLSYATLEAVWPYGSPKDCEHHQIHFCEACYDWLHNLLKAYNIEIDIAEADIWNGKSLLDIGERE